MESLHFSQLLDGTHGTPRGVADEDVSFSRLCTDSREAKRGDIFWAIRGEKQDGHDFAAEALKKGAALVVVDQAHAEQINGPSLVVENTLTALQDLARWYRHQREALVIGVTGSVGKTTTKDMIHTVLSARHSGVKTQHNFNNEIGLPLSLLGMAADDEFGVFEMGAARVGDIRALCETACPEVGVITKIGPAHLQSFGSVDNIYLGKGELLDSLPSHGFAVIGGDDDRMRDLASRCSCPVIFVGEKSGNTIRATNVEVRPEKLIFTVDRKRYEVPATGRHYLTAALCSVAVAREIGMDAGAIAAGLQKFVGEAGRSRAEKCGDWTIIDDTYNANPTSMLAACCVLQEWPTPNKRIMVTGDMLELGAEASALHVELGSCVAHAHVDRLLSLGRHAADVAKGAQSEGMSVHSLAACEELDPLLTVLDCWLEPGDVILVKGSRGMQMERVIAWLKKRVPPDHHARQKRAVA